MSHGPWNFDRLVLMGFWTIGRPRANVAKKALFGKNVCFSVEG
jgi:hypothetical protein